MHLKYIERKFLNKKYQPLDLIISTLKDMKCVIISLAFLLLTLNLFAQSNSVKKSKATAFADSVTVGVHYYPWYKGASGSNVMRYRLEPTQRAVLGLSDTELYESRDQDVIGQHIEWSKQANIDVWFTSWWGPGSYTDNSLKNHILENPKMGEIQYAILYESTGRLGDGSSPDYSNLVSDFEYLQDNYFNDSNYYKINDKPVVFIYLSRVYFRDQGDQALNELRNNFPNLYLIGDDVFGPGYNYPNDAENFEAISAYDAYGQSMGPYGSTTEALDQLALNYDDAIDIANGVNTGFVPAIAPGFNDRAVRDGHSGAPRYLDDISNSRPGHLFRKMLENIAIPRLDGQSDSLVLVTSFNEWMEDTQIEPTAGNAGTTYEDNSSSGTYYTEGDYYTDYGTLYLKILNNVFSQMIINGEMHLTADAGEDQTVEYNEENGDVSVTLNGSGSFNTEGPISNYSWSKGSSQIATGENPSVEFSKGKHTIILTVTADNGATASDIVIITVGDETTGIKEDSDLRTKIYPSPVDDILNVKSNKSSVETIQIYDMLGIKLKEVHNRSLIDMGDLEDGLYMVKAIIDGEKTTRIIIKE